MVQGSRQYLTLPRALYTIHNNVRAYTVTFPSENRPSWFLTLSCLWLPIDCGRLDLEVVLAGRRRRSTRWSLLVVCGWFNSWPRAHLTVLIIVSFFVPNPRWTLHLFAVLRYKSLFKASVILFPIRWPTFYHYSWIRQTITDSQWLLLVMYWRFTLDRVHTWLLDSSSLTS